MSDRIAIIGAGIAGITAARTLKDAGCEITLFEKSGGTGGRLSTRRTDYGNFDHGAQYITAKGDAFRAMMTGLSNAGAVGFWHADGKTTDKEWHVGTPGMSNVVKPILKDINLHLSTRITEIEDQNDALVCMDEDGKSSSFDRIIVAIPSPQAHALLAPFDDVFASLASVIYMPCWTAMFAFDARVDTLPDVYRGDDNEIISWLARNSSKPERSGHETFVAQSGALWSDKNLERTKEDVLEDIKTALEEKAGTALSPIYAQAHRWRYARVDKPLGTAFLANRDNRVFAIGDGMLAGRVEAAFESARQLCDHLKSDVL